jgi:Phospholipase_D-nuclease N-terminal
MEYVTKIRITLRGSKMYSIIGLLVLALDIFAILKIIQSPASGIEKILWILCVLLFPMIGMVIWFFAGPGGKNI